MLRAWQVRTDIAMLKLAAVRQQQQRDADDDDGDGDGVEREPPPELAELAGDAQTAAAAQASALAEAERRRGEAKARYLQWKARTAVVERNTSRMHALHRQKMQELAEIERGADGCRAQLRLERRKRDFFRERAKVFAHALMAVDQLEKDREMF